MMFYGPWGQGGFAYWMMVPMLAWWVFLVSGGLLALRWLARTWHPESAVGADTALEVARVRYAKGEISKEEFEIIRRDIAT